jgi:SAM-dependent methyltransferase
MTRNFYGTLAVRDHTENAQPRRSLIHGTIRHGYQFLDPARRDVAASYYGEDSGVGRVLRKRQTQQPMRVGVIGLGVGTLASYARRDDEFSIYEINPAVVDIAQHQFTFLTDARQRGAKLDLVMGDARLSLERQPPQHFDVLILDAFSSDAIPMHLLTREAFAQYQRHLADDGILVVHISNRYLDLEPVCERAAQQLHRAARLLHTSMSSTTDASDWVIVSSGDDYWSDPVFADTSVEPLRAPPSFTAWTDQYSSLWPLLKLRTR